MLHDVQDDSMSPHRRGSGKHKALIVAEALFCLNNAGNFILFFIGKMNYLKRNVQ